MSDCILIVDDEMFARRLLEMLLERNGYEVISASNAEQGLNMLRTKAVQAITCDLLMPGMDGIAFVRRLRADPALCHIPVIMVTAAGMQEELDQACQAGADATLIKPFSERQLIQLVHRLTRRHEA